MSKRPIFDLSDLPTLDSLTKCKDFVEKLKESNRGIAEGLREGTFASTVDANLEIIKSDAPELKIKEQEEEAIVLEVGAGVFDVKGDPMSKESAKKAGVTVVDVDSEVVKEPTPLITEIVRDEDAH
ncbi:hypothetical protein BEWA_031560 [Theileria equi strain WA]|uniref:Uncharacterized protein n=1 Tax=Theileria equi strain WA TaxID=1537102 RepID=L0AYH1_THEEQ|nr:hypothetical protein BEWA_031560 [Theileria equi strain WA]AFZ80303.1 hypothetical protein BEWA_031560 [Theileria equi strain WA]|eukprot:XP_004829969.1 hypothetical protein BEWA_031560 [Theileria equi strain WA]